jgi:murein peptide amidase A
VKRGLAAFAVGQVAVVLLVGAAPDAGDRDAPQRAGGGERSDVIARSVQGRPIVARRIGETRAERTALVVGSIHGDETEGHRVIRRLRRHHDRRLDGVDVWTISGGYESGPRAFSEPESRAVRDLVRRVRPDLTVWYHQPWGVTLVPCNHTGDVARRYARLSGLPPRDCHPYPPGSATSWQYHRFGKPAFVVEFPGRRLRQAAVRRHAAAVEALAER